MDEWLKTRAESPQVSQFKSKDYWLSDWKLWVRCFLSSLTVMRCGLIARRLGMISLFHGRSPRLSVFVGLRSLGRPHGTHSQHTWKIKIWLLLSQDQNSNLTFLVSKSLICFFFNIAVSLIRLYVSAWYNLLASYAALSQWILICKGALTNDFSYRIISYRKLLTLACPHSSPSGLSWYQPRSVISTFSWGGGKFYFYFSMLLDYWDIGKKQHFI